MMETLGDADFAQGVANVFEQVATSNVFLVCA
jgi:hypothetical protein